MTPPRMGTALRRLRQMLPEQNRNPPQKSALPTHTVVFSIAGAAFVKFMNTVLKKFPTAGTLTLPPYEKNPAGFPKPAPIGCLTMVLTCLNGIP